MTTRRPTNKSCNTTITPFTGIGSSRHCMTCDKWRPMAGGKKNPRTGLWQCSCCVSVRLAKAVEAAA